MLDLETIKKRLTDSNLKKVAKSSGVSYSALCRIINTDCHNVWYSTVRKLSDYLEGKE